MSTYLYPRTQRTIVKGILMGNSVEKSCFYEDNNEYSKTLVDTRDMLRGTTHSVHLFLDLLDNKKSFVLEMTNDQITKPERPLTDVELADAKALYEQRRRIEALRYGNSLN